MVAHVSCLRSMIMRRLGQLDDAAADAKLALDFKLATSPPLAVAYAAAPCIDALTCLGRLDEAEAVAAAAAEREPPPGWIHTLLFLQARGALRVAQQRPGEALDDLIAAAEGWRALDMEPPPSRPGAPPRPPRTSRWATRRGGIAGQRAARAGQEGRHRGRTRRRAALLRRDRRQLRAGPGRRVPGRGVNLLEATPARYELALALADLGAHLRRTGRPGEARAPLRRALDLAQRSGAAPLADQARRELLATGARPRRTALTGPDALTSAERRVAGLAAGWHVQPADRPAPVHHLAHRGNTPAARLPQARHHLTGRPARPTGQ